MSPHSTSLLSAVSRSHTNDGMTCGLPTSRNLLSGQDTVNELIPAGDAESLLTTGDYLLYYIFAYVGMNLP